MVTSVSFVTCYLLLEENKSVSYSSSAPSSLLLTFLDTQPAIAKSLAPCIGAISSVVWIPAEYTCMRCFFLERAIAPGFSVVVTLPSF